MNLGLLILRLVLGSLLSGHGAQKLFGWFGGHGLEGTGGWFESVGLRPGWLLAVGAGGAEFVGGVLVALGLLTPLGAALITAVMVTAVITVHAKNGPWVTENGYEYNLLIVAAVLALAGAGAGEWSLDNALSLDVAGTAWAIGALAAGVVGGFGALVTGKIGNRSTGEPRAHAGAAA